MTTSRIGNSKIIFLIVLIMTLIIAGLFIYRSQHMAAPKVMSADAGTVFATPRDIKNFKLIQDKNKPFTEQDLRGHWTLMFFGFTHCASICPTTLSMLQRVYEQLPADHSAIQTVFVSLDPERDSPASLATYTKSFNASFIGVTGKIQDVRKLQSQFGIYSAPDASPTANYQIQHTASIMLINPQGQWAGLFHYGLNPQQFSQALGNAIS